MSHAQMNYSTKAISFSGYIPIIHRDLTEETIKTLFAPLGIIARIDFVEPVRPKKHFRSAFLHFEIFKTNDLPIIDTNGLDLQYFVRGHGPYIYQGEPAEMYSLTLLRARNPIPTTQLNIHQIAHNLKVLEESLWGSLSKKEEQIRNLEDIIADQHRQLNTQRVMIRLLQQGQSNMKNKDHLTLDTNTPPPSVARGIPPAPGILRRQTNAPEQQFFLEDDNFNSPMSTSLINDSVAPMNMRFDACYDEAESVSTHDSMPSLIPIACNDKPFAHTRPDSWDYSDASHPFPVVYNAN